MIAWLGFVSESLMNRIRSLALPFGAVPIGALIVVGSLLATSVARADVLHGLGVMGDSGSDGSSVNKWPGMLQADRGLNFGGAGLPFNHAVSGATSSTVLSGGQNTALATQVSAGSVTTGIILIGNNDYGGVATSLANGTLNGTALTNFQTSIVTNIETATGSVLFAGAQGFLLGSVDDFTVEPVAAAIAADPTEKARVQNSISAVNAQLQAYAAGEHIPFVNFYALENTPGFSGSITVGGVAISLVNTGSDPHDFFLDGLHPGIVGNALIANMWMEGLNVAYSTNLSLFSDQQILNLAGLGGSYTGETFSTAINMANYIDFVPAPEPASWALLAAGFATLLMGTVVRRRG